MENVKIESIEEKFISLTEVNNYNWEIFDHKLSNGEISYTLIVKDFLKYPDKFRDILASFPHFNNYIHDTGRPGKSFLFHPEFNYRCSFFIRKLLFDAFKLDTRCRSIYTNCMPGKSDSVDVNVVPPHVDLFNVYDHRSSPSLVTNLGLTKGIENNGTSFWTFRGKRGPLDMKVQELNEYQLYQKDNNIHENVICDVWNNTQNDSDWNLEYIVPLEYNSLVCYSPTWFHQPYYNKNDFINIDRFSLASFYELKMEEVSEIPEELIPDAFDIWKKFDLCKIYNYYF